jgi:site-specific recombinase XerD
MPILKIDLIGHNLVYPSRSFFNANPGSGFSANQQPYVFVTKRKGPLTTSTVRKMVAKAGVKAKIKFQVHPHMLRHGCGFKLANDGQVTRAIQHYLGHRNIQHTVRYTALHQTASTVSGRIKPFD